MTATAYAVPLVFAWPEAAPLALVMCLVIGWSRVALGHHYVSDVMAGTVLGAAISTPVAAILL
jgi:membrane-associated phospholipid phosphatase